MTAAHRSWQRDVSCQWSLPGHTIYETLDSVRLQMLSPHEHAVRQHLYSEVTSLDNLSPPSLGDQLNHQTKQPRRPTDFYLGSAREALVRGHHTPANH